MPAVPTKKMLETLLRSALSAKDREKFESMWDAVHRYGKLSKRQIACIEDAYYKIDKNPKPPGKRVGFVTSPLVNEEKQARSLEHFLKFLPDTKPDSEIYRKISAFFKAGGEVVKIRPPKKE